MIKFQFNYQFPKHFLEISHKGLNFNCSAIQFKFHPSFIDLNPNLNIMKL